MDARHHSSGCCCGGGKCYTGCTFSTLRTVIQDCGPPGTHTHLVQCVSHASRRLNTAHKGRQNKSGGGAMNGPRHRKYGSSGVRLDLRLRLLAAPLCLHLRRGSSGKDETIGTVEDLTALLEEIPMEERERDCCGELPEAAVVPVMKRKAFKELGDLTAQAAELAVTIKELSNEELLALAEAEHQRLEEAGELDGVGDEQGDDAPTLDESIIGSQLEVCWRYWRPPTDEEKAGGEKRKKIGVKIWCEGTVEQVANGTTDKESARCKNLLKAGAVRIRWPADAAHNEPESLTLTPKVLARLPGD